MNDKEAGFLLLTSHLGNPDRRPLTVRQFCDLSQRMQSVDSPRQERELELEDLLSFGYGRQMGQRILNLLDETDLLQHYLQRGWRMDCVALSRIHPFYPSALRRRLGMDAPGCIWGKGDVTLLTTKMISLVGSRDLLPDNRKFAEAVGYQAAKQGYTLVSGNARGADKAAQNACLEAGGRVISIVADELCRQPLRERVLYLSEDDFDAPFSAQRALSRNRCIHALADKTFVAQCTQEKGGTWDGTVKNLRFGWSHVYLFDDKSTACTRLEQQGGTVITVDDLANLSALNFNSDNFLTGSE